MKLYDKLKNVHEGREAPRKAEVKPKVEESTELPQCACGSNIAGECPDCYEEGPEPAIIDKLREIGDRHEINPPLEKEEAMTNIIDKPKKTRKPKGPRPCPTCGKVFERLGRHKCPEADKEPERLTEPSPPPVEVEEPTSDYEIEVPVEEFTSTTIEPEDETNEIVDKPTIEDPQYDLYIDCMFYIQAADDDVLFLTDILGPCEAAVCTENNVPHWNLVNFGKGTSMLAEKLESWLVRKNPEGVIIALSGTKEFAACREVLIRHARSVVIGLGR